MSKPPKLKHYKVRLRLVPRAHVVMQVAAANKEEAQFLAYCLTARQVAEAEAQPSWEVVPRNTRLLTKEEEVKYEYARYEVESE